MAILAVPFIEAAAVHVLIALGVGAAGQAAKDVARQRQEEADKSRVSPIARTEAQTIAQEKCKECPPDAGAPVARKTAGWPEVSIAYQVRICGLPVGPGFITEWKFNGVTFDGFDSGQCRLKEAKGNYDQFFDKFGLRKPYWEGDRDMLEQAVKQCGVAAPMPPVQLWWYFLQPVSYRYFSKMFASALLPIETVHLP